MKNRNKVKRVPTKRHAATRESRIYLPARESIEIVGAIRRGKVDALVVAGKKGNQVLVLEGSDHPYKLLIETISDGAATLDSNGAVLYANKRFMEILDIPSDKIIGHSLQSCFAAAAREKIDNLIQMAVRDRSQGEISIDTPGGRQRLIRLSFNTVKNSDPCHVCVVVTELTELLEANEALRSNEESLRQLSARLLQLQDEERRRIARDLHDITGQNLSVQSMLLGQLDKASGNMNEESRKTLRECRNLTDQLIEEIRTVSYLLHPPLLDELGLASAIEWYIEGFSRRSGIATKSDIASNFGRLPREIEVTLFRIVQESLTNVHRYSESTTAIVRVRSKIDEIVLEVRDFGKGIQPEALHPKYGTVAPLGVGIQGMRERMRQLSGKLEITSRPNEGTVITAILPFRAGQTKKTPRTAAKAL